MAKISVVIPTVEGRERYLKRCIDGYENRHNTEHEIEIIVEKGHDHGGTAWQLGSERATGDYLHLTNDDIVPGFNYLEPMIEATDRNCVPVVIVVTTIAEILDENLMPLSDNPLPENHSWAYEGPPFVPNDWYEADSNDLSKYPSLPFCSMEQWGRIGPMIYSHYGTDKWFGWRARQAGFPNKVRNNSIFYHYSATEKREGVIQGWLGHDRLTFDQNFALPMYMSGELKPDELHPEWNTAAGLEITRQWYIDHVPRGQGYYWETHNYWEDKNDL
jgi:hypothetical protein